MIAWEVLGILLHLEPKAIDTHMHRGVCTLNSHTPPGLQALRRRAHQRFSASKASALSKKILANASVRGLKNSEHGSAKAQRARSEFLKVSQILQKTSRDKIQI